MPTPTPTITLTPTTTPTPTFLSDVRKACGTTINSTASVEITSFWIDFTGGPGTLSAVFYSIGGATTTFGLYDNNRDLIYTTTTDTFDEIVTAYGNSTLSLFVTVEAFDPLDVNWKIETLCL
jgi:hypothetical protein